MKTPLYFEYFNKTYKIVRMSESGVQGYLLNLVSGDFELNNDLIGKVLAATTASDISALDEDEFIDQTERIREDYLRGDGPIFALYETIDGLYEQRKREGRRFTPEERALIRKLRRQTFTMWEEEFARRAAGEPPSFQYTSTMA